MNNRTKALLGAAGVALFLHAGASQAQLLPNCTLYQSSQVPASCTTGATPTVLSTPGAYSYSDTTLQSDSSSGGIITGSTYPAGYTGASFYDAFVVQVTNSNGASISSTLNEPITGFAITNFQERLYSYTGTAPIVGPVSGAIDAWTYPAGPSGTVAVLPSTFLPTGTYVIEVRGDVTGGSGGAYSGTFTLGPAPVPLPAAGWLLVSGMGGLLGFARKLRQA